VLKQRKPAAEVKPTDSICGLVRGTKRMDIVWLLFQPIMMPGAKSPFVARTLRTKHADFHFSFALKEVLLLFF